MCSTPTSSSSTIGPSLVLALLLSIAVASDEDTGNILASFFQSGRVITETTTVGITLLSNLSESENYVLTNGYTDEMIIAYRFVPPTGSSPQDYTISFSCDTTTPTVLGSSSCVVENAVATILNSESTAYNTTVSCNAQEFPGTASCGLSASPKATLRTPLDGTESSFRQDASGVYRSEKVTFIVYGVVFYSGELSNSPNIVSGEENSYKLASYDRTDQGVREISVYSYLPGLGIVSGTSAKSFFSAAKVTTKAVDYILRYNDADCTLTNANVQNGVVVLPSSETCSLGIAEESDGSLTLGAQFRTYKSGAFTLFMSWETFGTSQDTYTQQLIFDITERAPPVITTIKKELLYRSTPCDVEKIFITAYNVRFATTKTLRVQNSDDSTSSFPEVKTEFTYDSSTDSSIVTFESTGGSGTNVLFTLVVKYGNTEVSGVILDSSLVATMSFSTPPDIASMSPSKSPVSGGQEIVLTGIFEGFDSDAVINIGGYTISGSDVSIPNNTVLTFSTPALSSLGRPYTYEIAVAICAETSDSFTLSYEVSPTLTITAVDSNVDSSGSYIVPSDGAASFLAETSGNIDGILYIWKLYTSGGVEVNTGDITTNSQLMSISSSILSSTTELYNLTCTVQNALQLTESKHITVKLAASDTDYLLVSVYSVEDLFISVDTVTLVQSSVQLISETSSVVTLESSQVNLAWNYGGDGFSVDNSSADSSVTGPTQLGLEFNIARRDLMVGETKLELTASLVDKPAVTGTGSITITVKESVLKPEINNGVNGSLVLTGSDLTLSAENSTDPDILDGDASAGLSYLWLSCSKSLKSSFSNGVEDCASLFPSDLSTVSITILASNLLAARLDTQSDPDPTYFSFGVRVTKGERASEQYLYFELRTVTAAEQLPELSALNAVDVKGVSLQEYSIFRDIIIQPESDDPFATWGYDMSLSSQKYLFVKNGVLKPGDGFTTSRGVKSRSLLGFAAGSLQASTEYKVSVKVSTANSSLEAKYEISFRTEDAPSLTCIPPETPTGTIYETRFVVSGQLSFEAQNIEYCFYLVSTTGKRYKVGKGCSPVQFAEFSFPHEGSYSIECLAKNVAGAIVKNVTLPSSLVLVTPTPSPGASQIEILQSRLQVLNNEVTTCEALRDHTCIETLIVVATDITAKVSTLLETDTSTEAQELFENGKEYIARLSVLSESLADRTVYRPNVVEDSLNQALYMSQVSASFVDTEETLFGYMKSAENAVNSTTSESSTAIIGNEVVEVVSAIANLTLATSYSISQDGSSRKRLRQSTGVTRSAYGAVLNTATNFIVQMRAQQETCGYVGSESTKYPENLSGSSGSVSSNVDIPPVDVRVKVACTREQVSSKLIGSDVELEVLCNDILGATEVRRIVVTLVSMPSSVLKSIGLVENIDSYVDPLVVFNTDGVLTDLPSDCFQIQLNRKKDTLSDVGTDENLVVGFLRNIPDASTDCSKQKCYEFERSGSATFGSAYVTVRTNDNGLLIAGNLKSVAPLVPFGTLEGIGIGITGQAVRALIAGIGFVVAAVVVTWLAVSGVCVSASPEAGAGGSTSATGTMWEYVERDLFGRESHLKEGSRRGITEAEMSIPKGAKPPQIGM